MRASSHAPPKTPLVWYRHITMPIYDTSTLFPMIPNKQHRTVSSLLFFSFSLFIFFLIVKKTCYHTPVRWCLATSIWYVLVQYSCRPRVSKVFWVGDQLENSNTQSSSYLCWYGFLTELSCLLTFLSRHNNKVSTNDDARSLYTKRHQPNHASLSLPIIQLAWGPQKDRVSIIEREQTGAGRKVRGFGYSSPWSPRCYIII